MSEHEQREIERKAREQATSVAQRLNLDIGAALVESIVDNFWTAPVVGMTYQQSRTPDGQVTMLPVPRMGTSPMATVAHEMYGQYSDQIVAAVVERLDPAELADAVAAKIVKTLTEDRGLYGAKLNPTAQQVHDAARAKLAERLSEQAMAAYEAEQAEMRAALAEKRERERGGS